MGCKLCTGRNQDWYGLWIYCPICELSVLRGIDTEPDYKVINKLSRKGEKVIIPLTYCHVTEPGTNLLMHIKSVEQTDYETKIDQVSFQYKNNN